MAAGSQLVTGACQMKARSIEFIWALDILSRVQINCIEMSQLPPVSPPEKKSLWDRVEGFLKDQPWAVVVLLLVVVLGGVKNCLEAIQSIVQAWHQLVDVRPDESQLLSCSKLGREVSGAVGHAEQFTIYLTNSYNPTPIEYTWVDSKGVPDPKIHFRVAQGQQVEEPSFPSHVWLVSDATHPCVALIKLGKSSIIVDERDGDFKLSIRKAFDTK